MATQQVHVYVDNSNVWIEGKKYSGKISTPRVPSNYRYRIEYGHLLNLVLDGRSPGAMPELYGSEPPPNDSVWKMIRSKGYNVQVFKRNFFGHEKQVDTRMTMDIGKLIYKLRTVPAVLVIVAGDADFIPATEDARAEGWTVEVWYWSHAMSGDLKQVVDRFEALDAHAYTIGYDA